MTLQQRTYEVMERAEQGDSTSRAFDLFIVTLIGLNVAMVILETVPAIYALLGPFFQVFETFSVVIFTVEYILRLWACTADPDYESPITGRLKFSLSGFALVDLLAIAPFYLQLFLNLDPTLVGAVRLFRLFRLFKMGRYIRSIRLLGVVIRQKRSEMYLVATVLVIVLVMISSLMYYVEHDAQPDAFSSIPAAMWWGMVTLTTIGYGDVFPVTPLGRFFGILIAMLGIGMFALPAGILSSGFIDAIASEKGEGDRRGTEEEADAQIVTGFIEAANRRELAEITRLLSSDHKLHTPDNRLLTDKEEIGAFWEQRFIDGYVAEIRSVVTERGRVVVTGSVWHASAPSRPAAWEARLRDGLIAEFYCIDS